MSVEGEGCGAAAGSARRGPGEYRPLDGYGCYASCRLDVEVAHRFNGAAGAGKPPKSAPAPAKGTDVWWISCGQAAEACSIPTHAAEVAAKKLGWEFHIADGRFDENGGYLSAVRTAVAANPDAIVIDGFDCPAAEAALEEAKAQHIVLMGLTSNDCSSSGGPELFSAEMKYGENATSVSEFNKSWGERAASYLIEATGGQAKVINEEGTSEGLEQEVSAAFDAFDAVAPQYPRFG